MPTRVAQKFKIKPGYTLLCINEPANFRKNLGPLPRGCVLARKANAFNQIHWFVLNRAQLHRELPQVLGLIKLDVLCWIYYPKSSSKIQTDLTRDKGWDELLTFKELQWIGLVAFDETWSAFACRRKKELDSGKTSAPAVRAIDPFVDLVDRTIRLPVELENAFKKHKNAANFFHGLSFTNKKEFVEWLVTAKREETKTKRLNETIERLNLGWKNPRNL